MLPVPTGSGKLLSNDLTVSTASQYNQIVKAAPFILPSTALEGDALKASPLASPSTDLDGDTLSAGGALLNDASGALGEDAADVWPGVAREAISRSPGEQLGTLEVSASPPPQKKGKKHEEDSISRTKKYPQAGNHSGYRLVKSHLERCRDRILKNCYSC